VSASTPLVSIVIPTYNRERSVQRAIASAQAQTYPNIEIIVTDNASRDRTIKVVELMAKADPRIRYYRYEHNIGPVGNWWRGVNLARGEYIKILFSDDWLENHCIKKMISPFLVNNKKKPSLVYCDCVIWNLDNKNFCSTRRAGGYLPSVDFVLGYLDRSTPLTPSACLFPSLPAKKYFCHQYSDQDKFYFDRGIGNDSIWLWRIVNSGGYAYYIKEFLLNFSSNNPGEPCITANTKEEKMSEGYDQAFIQFISEISQNKALCDELKIAFCLKERGALRRFARYRKVAKKVSFPPIQFFLSMIR
jgi:glycosyltransferase involved in cell wall biosynthesis